ncbi:7825_t:CDS:10, partial [Paraglomus occultum]
QKHAKNTLFNLEDEELTHYGQSLSSINYFGDGLDSGDEGEGKGIIDEETVARTHFGGFNAGDNDDKNSQRRKQNSEIWNELIAKSKFHKYERQLEKEKYLAEEEELDKELDDIRGLLFESSNRVTGKIEENREKSLDAHHDSVDSYDRFVRELAFEKRARPTNRTKTEEELLLEEKNKLERLERARRKRMLGVDETSEEEEEDNDEDDRKRRKRRKRRDIESESENEENEAVTLPASLPYTFPCPQTYEEFMSVLRGVELKDVPTVVHRICVLHHLKLDPSNKEKLEAKYVLNIANEGPLPTAFLSSLTTRLFSLTHMLPHITRRTFSSQLSLAHSHASVTMSDLTLLMLISKLFPTTDFHHPITTPAMILMGQCLSKNKLNTIKDIVIGLVICSLVYEYVCITRKIVPEVGNFLCSVLVAFVADKGFEDSESGNGECPESENLKIRELPGVFPLVGKIGMMRKGKGNWSTIVPKAVNVPQVVNRRGEDGDNSNDEMRVCILSSAISLVGQFAKLYNSTAAFIEIFEPMVLFLKLIPVDELSNVMMEKLLSTKDALNRMLRFAKDARKPLALQHHKPIPLPTYRPKFDENYSLDRHYDSREMAPMNKLKAQYKQELKGAIRELRKDARFLAHETLKKVRESDESYRKTIKSVMNKLESEQHEKKLYDRERKKLVSSKACQLQANEHFYTITREEGSQSEPTSEESATQLLLLKELTCWGQATSTITEIFAITTAINNSYA